MAQTSSSSSIPAERLLSVRSLSVAFSTRVIIHDLTFQVTPGQSLAVIGPNGAGKTVLLSALLHLVPYGGEIHWSPGARIGYVPQKVAADRQIPLQARDLMQTKASLLKLPATDLDDVSREVGLTPELLNTHIGKLSGGQFQKALIAFALLGRPNVLLFDEPTASLDELSEERIYELLHNLQTEKGMTVILVSHDLSIVYRYADMVLCLGKGHACLGPPREVLTPKMLEDLYGAPAKYHLHAEGH